MDQNMIGKLNADGSILSWPTVNIHGQEYTRENVTRAHVDSTRFVVLPIGVVWTKELKDEFTGKQVSQESAPSIESASKKSKGE